MLTLAGVLGGAWAVENVAKRKLEMASRSKVTARIQEYTPNKTLIQKDWAVRKTEIMGPGKRPVTTNLNTE